MIINWFKMKKIEIECKLTIYTHVAAFLKEKEEILSLVKKIYDSLKDVPASDIQTRFIAEIAALVHDSNEKEPM